MRHAKHSDASQAAPQDAPQITPPISSSPTRRQRKKSNLLSNILIIVGVILLAVAGGMWLQAQLRYRQQAKVNEALAEFVTIEPAAAVGEGDEGPKPPTVDWEGLKAINGDVIAWIQIPDTVINYPVYQAANNERYLRNTATGEWSWGGQLFADYECTAPGMVDPQTLIYGHHLLDGTMFKPIADMEDQEAFDAVDTIWYVTEQSVYECTPLFLYYTQDDDQTVRTFKFPDADAFHLYLNERLGRAVAKRSDAANIVPSVTHVLSLITCNYYDGYGRTILVCVPKDEANAALAAQAQPVE